MRIIRQAIKYFRIDPDTKRIRVKYRLTDRRLVRSRLELHMASEDARSCFCATQHAERKKRLPKSQWVFRETVWYNLTLKLFIVARAKEGLIHLELGLVI